MQRNQVRVPEVVVVVDLVVAEVVVVSKILGMEADMEVGSQIQGTEVMVVAINNKVVTVVAANSKVATVVLLVVVNNRVAMTEAMEVSNRLVVLLLQVMTHKLRDTVPSHLQLIPTTKAMVPKTGPHNLEAMVLLLLHLVMELGLVPIKGIKLKVRDMIKLKHLNLPILLEVALMDRLHHNNMEANLHMVVVRLVDRLRATMHSQLHNTRKDKAILRLHQVMEILVPGTDEKLSNETSCNRL